MSPELPKQFPGAIRVVCPGCGKPTRSHLGGGGWTMTWCNKCRVWFRTANEIMTPRLAAQYQISLPELPPSSGNTDQINSGRPEP